MSTKTGKLKPCKEGSAAAVYTCKIARFSAIGIILREAPDGKVCLVCLSRDTATVRGVR